MKSRWWCPRGVADFGNRSGESSLNTLVEGRSVTGHPFDACQYHADMRLLFDGYWWGSGPVSNRQVMREFIWAWESEFPSDELVVAVRRRDLLAARAELPDRVEIVGTRLAPQGLSAIAELPWLARRHGVDVTLTHNFTPAFGRSAVFVHDFMFMTSPQWFTRKERIYFALMPASIRRSSVVFTSSATEAARIRSRAGRRPVIPVGLAVGSTLANATPRRPAGLDVDGFLLSVGRLNERKNLATAILGALESERLSERFPLLVVGESGGRSGDLPLEAAGAVAAGAVRFLGFTDDAELAWLYAHTDGLLFLSHDEGFGMPTLEALQFGAPIIASDIPVFREIVGELGTLVDPLDVDAVASAVRALPPRVDGGGVDPESRGYSWGGSARAMRAALVGG